METFLDLLKIGGIAIALLIVVPVLGIFFVKLLAMLPIWIFGEERALKPVDYLDRKVVTPIEGWFEDLGDLLGELPDGWRSRRQFRRRMVKHREETDRKNREILAERERERRERESASNGEALALKREGEAEE